MSSGQHSGRSIVAYTPLNAVLGLARGSSFGLACETVSLFQMCPYGWLYRSILGFVAPFQIVRTGEIWY